MSTKSTIAFLGAGNMAGALIKGLLEAERCRSGQIVASDIREERLAELRREHRIKTTGDNRRAASGAQVVVLSTKPQVFPLLLPEIAGSIRPDQLVLSIAAGVPISVIESSLPHGSRVIRAMPNTAALVQAGATGLAAGSNATKKDMETARQIFEAVGAAVVVNESLLDAVTGLSGSGPAYVFVFIEALADAGVEMGLSRESAQTLAAQTVLGSARMVMETGEHPARLKVAVTSPGGTTIAGLQALEAGGLRKAVADAVRNATRRSRALGLEAASKLADS
jgi:pyrroline-5-carboxylate reductase